MHRIALHRTAANRGHALHQVAALEMRHHIEVLDRRMFQPSGETLDLDLPGRPHLLPEPDRRPHSSGHLHDRSEPT